MSGVPRRRLAVVAGAVLAVCLVGGVLGWAGARVFGPAPGTPGEAAWTLVTVVEGEVSSSLALSAVATWGQTPVGTNLAVGTVTTVDIQPGDEVNAGDRLYSVDLRPVAVAVGDVPAFRDLAAGASGPDVAQLQRMLTAVGAYAGSPNGSFDASTRAAVRSWQLGLGMPADGIVRVGDVIFVPSLPARLALDAALVVRGARLSGGEAVLQALAAVPEFTIPVTESQAGLAAPGTAVQITAPQGGVWSAVVASRRTTPQGVIELVLASASDGPICADACGSVPVVDRVQLACQVIVVAPTRGLVVPSAALLSRADGSVVVIDEAGLAHPVTVVASARGLSVITGVEAGLRVRAPAQAP